MRLLELVLIKLNANSLIVNSIKKVILLINVGNILCGKVLGNLSPKLLEGTIKYTIGIYLAQLGANCSCLQIIFIRSSFAYLGLE